ncbi:MAG: DUF1501 domain-containing protein [Sphingomonadaceae bacterium]|nr:DUF1501 domain-containing protein [Sphingomonadaceae bacterium]
MKMAALDRRTFLAGAAGALALLAAPQIAVAQAATDRRFVFIIQRGAADGLGTLAPTADPAFAGLRGAFAEDFAAGARLGDFTLHPNMAAAAQLYQAREALFVHAVASPYRDRSHFDGQNVLETGGNAAYTLRDGWMNRLLSLLPANESRAIAVSATVPVVLRGSREVASYAPSNLPDAPDDLLARVTQLYAQDTDLHAAWAQAMQTRTMAGDLSAANGQNGAATGMLAARLLSGPEGARLAVIDTGGWDTHANQRGRLGFQLRGLDAMLGALKAGLGADWANTLVVVATEFGRTAAPNGTGGTDHGTASLAMLFGGAVAGGRVLADWPGLGQAALYEGRDLKPTLDLDVLLASAVAEHYRLDLAHAGRTLFPNIGNGRPVEGLIRA